jgi:hypothetical protein
MSDLNNTDVTDNDVTDVETTEDEWTPPTREEWEEVLEKKRRADSEAASRKRWLRDLGYDPKTGEKLPDGSQTAAETDDGPTDRQDSAKPAAVDTVAIEKAALAKGAGIVIALADAGVGPKSLDRVSKLIDVNGDIPAQVEALKEEFPEFFKRPRTSVADASAVGAGTKKAPTGEATKSYAEIMADRLLGK